MSRILLDARGLTPHPTILNNANTLYCQMQSVPFWGIVTISGLLIGGLSKLLFDGHYC